MPNGELVEYGSHIKERVAPDVLGDIEPYQSMVTGEMINSRSRHREHLKDHGCVEVGNDQSLARPYQGIPEVAPQQRRELIRAQVNDMTHEQLRRAIKRDVDNVKWNSRER
jgi:hypothetical protein